MDRRRVGWLAVAVVVLAAAGYAVTTRLRDDAVAYDVLWETNDDGPPHWRGQRADGGVTDFGPVDRGGRADLSPDGTRLAVMTANGVAVLSLRDRATRVHPLAPGVVDAPFVWPSWSPDGRTVAYPDADPATAASDRRTHRGFVLLDVASGASTRVAYPHGGDALSWSPDGSMLAVTRPPATGTRTPSPGIDLVLRAGTFVRTLPTEEAALVSSHAWSPDGERLAVRVPHTGRVLVVSPGAGNVLADLPEATYVWHDATHLRRVRDASVEVVGLDGAPTSTSPLRAATSAGGYVLRPAS